MFRKGMEMFGNWGGQNDNKMGGDKTPNQSQATNNNTNSNTDSKNDGDTDAALLQSVWNETKTGGDNTDTGGDPNGGNKGGGDNNRQVDTNQVMMDHLKSVGLEPFELSEAELEGFKNGEGVNELLKKINGQAINAYTHAMKNMDAIVEKKLQKAMENANTNTNNVIQGRELRQYLEDGIPFIKGDASLGPVAETAFNSFFTKTKGDRERSLKLTKAFLQDTADKVNASDPARQNSFGNRGKFSDNGGPATRDNDGNEGWLSVLRS